MRFLLVVLVFSFWTLNSKSQNSFIKVYSDVDATKPFSGRHIVKTSDNNYSFLCTNNNKPVIVRIDENGNEFNRFTIQWNRLNPICLAVTDQFEYYFVGRDSIQFTGYAEHTDSNGVIISHHLEYGAVGNSQAHGVYKTPDNNIMYNFWNNSEMCYDPEYFRKEDSLGNMVWERVTSNNMINPSKQSFQFLPGDKLAAVAPYLTGCYDTIQYYYSNLTIFNPIGVYTTYNFPVLYHTLDTTYGGGFILASIGQISRMDTTAGIAWTISMPPSMSFQIALRQLQDSSFILAGDQFITGYGQQIILNKYDWNGNLLWSQNYGGTGDEFFSNMLLESDGGFLISGRSNSYGPKSKAMIIKADSVGNSTALPTINSSTNIICSGDSTELSLPSGYTYLWSNGETRQAIYVSSANSYSAILTDTGGVQIYTDTVSLNVLTTVKPNLGPDQTLCIGQICILDAGTGYQYYQWNNGSFAQTDSINVGGNYIVEAIDSNSCSSYDTIQVAFVTLPPFTLGPDIDQCDTAAVTLYSPGILQWTWSDGSTDTTLTVDTSGLYYLVFTNGVCVDTSYINISLNQPLQVDLIDDTTVCVNQSVLLDAGPNFTSYLWQDGTVSRFYIASSTVPASLQYTVSVVDLNGCPTSDDVIVDFQICPSTNDKEFENGISIYPNPVSASSSLLIESKKYSKVSVQLFSISGEEVYVDTNKKLPSRISMNKISAGLYFLRVTDDQSGNYFNAKLIVQ